MSKFVPLGIVKLVKKFAHDGWSWAYYKLADWAEGYQVAIFRINKKHAPRLFVTNPEGHQIYAHTIEFARTDTELIAHALEVVKEDLQHRAYWESVKQRVLDIGM